MEEIKKEIEDIKVELERALLYSRPHYIIKGVISKIEKLQEKMK